MAELGAETLPADREVGTELGLQVEFDPTSIRGHSVTRVLPLSGIANELEGEHREVGYTTHRMPASLPL